MKTELIVNTKPLTASEAARLALFLSSLEDPRQNHGNILIRMNLDFDCRCHSEVCLKAQQIEQVDQDKINHK